jgi:dTDP-4-amino-4,6-dideoxygalactose transaminase
MAGKSPRWAALAQAGGAFFVDDAAQTLGSWCAGQPSGRWGDAGFYSLARGKNITAMGGGILVTDRDDLAEVLQQERVQLGIVTRQREIRTVVEALAFWTLLRPRLFWLARHIPGVRLQVFEIEPDFGAREMGGAQATLARRSWRRLVETNAVRRINGQRLRAALAGVAGIQIPVPSGGFASWLRLPVIFDDPSARDRAAGTLARHGLGASMIYPRAWYHLEGSPAIDESQVGATAELPSSLLALATHHMIRSQDIDAVARIVAEAADGGRRS